MACRGDTTPGLAGELTTEPLSDGGIRGLIGLVDADPPLLEGVVLTLRGVIDPRGCWLDALELLVRLRISSFFSSEGFGTTPRGETGLTSRTPVQLGRALSDCRGDETPAAVAVAEAAPAAVEGRGELVYTLLPSV